MRTQQLIIGLLCSSGLVVASDAHAVLVHEWNFDNGTANDSVGNADLTLVGDGTTITDGKLVLPGGDTRTHNAQATGGGLAELAATINGTDALSIVIRYNTTAQQTWAKTLMLGDSTSNYLDHTPARGGGQGQGLTFNDDAEANATLTGAPVIADGIDAIAIAIWDEASDSMYLTSMEAGNGATRSDISSTLDGGDLAGIIVSQFYLGSAVGFGDADFNGTIDLVQIYNHALTASEIGDLLGVNSTLIGDTDNDFDVDEADILNAINGFTGPHGTGATIATGDTDGDGDVDNTDMLRINANYTGSLNNSPAASVPEPAGATLALLLGLGAAGRRRRG